MLKITLHIFTEILRRNGEQSCEHPVGRMSQTPEVQSCCKDSVFLLLFLKEYMHHYWYCMEIFPLIQGTLLNFCGFRPVFQICSQVTWLDRFTNQVDQILHILSLKAWCPFIYLSNSCFIIWQLHLGLTMAYGYLYFAVCTVVHYSQLDLCFQGFNFSFLLK